MTQPSAVVTINLSGMRSFQRQMQPGTVTANKILDLWATRYRASMTRRFVKFSRGGGNWPPLKKQRKKKHGRTTKAGRADRRFKKRFGDAILRDTGLLLNALSPAYVGAPGQYQKKSGWSITVGYGGSAKHRKGRATIAGIATYHQIGAGHLPVRKVIDKPDAQTINGMVRDAKSVIAKVPK